MTATSTAPDRCRTCGGALPFAGPQFDPESGEWVTPEPFCSIHCEHYAALQHAAQNGTHSVV